MARYTSCEYPSWLTEKGAEDRVTVFADGADIPPETASEWDLTSLQILVRRLFEPTSETQRTPSPAFKALTSLRENAFGTEDVDVPEKIASGFAVNYGGITVYLRREKSIAGMDSILSYVADMPDATVQPYTVTYDLDHFDTVQPVKRRTPVPWPSGRPVFKQFATEDSPCQGFGLPPFVLSMKTYPGADPDAWPTLRRMLFHGMWRVPHFNQSLVLFNKSILQRARIPTLHRLLSYVRAPEEVYALTARIAAGATALHAVDLSYDGNRPFDANRSPWIDGPFSFPSTLFAPWLFRTHTDVGLSVSTPLWLYQIMGQLRSVLTFEETTAVVLRYFVEEQHNAAQHFKEFYDQLITTFVCFPVFASSPVYHRVIQCALLLADLSALCPGTFDKHIPEMLDALDQVLEYYNLPEPLAKQASMLYGLAQVRAKQAYAETVAAANHVVSGAPFTPETPVPWGWVAMNIGHNWTRATLDTHLLGMIAPAWLIGSVPCATFKID